MSRIHDHAAIAQKYDLELVAGNFFYSTYTAATNDILCYMSKCTGAPFPIPAPGINDGEDCQATKQTFETSQNQARVQEHSFR